LHQRLEYARSGVLVPDGMAMRLFEGPSVAAISTGMQFKFDKSAPLLEPAVIRN
jgi:hypothetical protein